MSRSRAALAGVAIATLAACGRLGFDSRERAGDGGGDSARGGDAGGDGAASAIHVAVTGHGAITVGSAACAGTCDVPTDVPLAATTIASEGWQLSESSCTSIACQIAPGETVSATFTPAPITANIAFVTSTLVQLGGAQSFDSVCNTLATDGGIAGSYVSFVSTTNVAAESRLTGHRGWVRPDGLAIVDQPTDFGDPTLPHPIGIDDKQAFVAAFVMTGADPEGASTGSNCGNWTTAGGGVTGGQSNWGGFYIVGDTESTCEQSQYPVYCFETDRDTTTVSVHPPAFPAGRILFSSHAQLPADAGIAGADTLCASEAANDDLPGHYAALLATTAQSAADHVGGVAGVWRRADGVVLTFDGLDTAVALDAVPGADGSGAPVQQSNVVWVGADALGVVGDNTCGDWLAVSDATATGAGYTGIAFDVALFHDPASSQCSASSHVLCAQLP